MQYDVKIPKVNCPPGKVAFIAKKKGTFELPAEFKNVLVSEPGEPEKRMDIRWPSATKVLVPGAVNGAAPRERLDNFAWPRDANIYLDPKADEDAFNFLHYNPYNASSPSFRAARGFHKHDELLGMKLDTRGAKFVEQDDTGDSISLMKARAYAVEALSLLSDTIGSFDVESNSVKLKPNGADKLSKVAYFLNEGAIHGGKNAEYALIQGMAANPASAKKVLDALKDKDGIESRVLFGKLVENGVISKRGTIYYFGEDALGKDEHVIAKLSPDAKEHSAIRETMLKILEHKLASKKA